MTREQHLRFCKVCQNQKFDPQRGIVCNLSDEIANFEKSCEWFDEYVSLLETPGNTSELKNNFDRARFAIYIFWAICLLNIVAVISSYFEYELLERIYAEGNYTEEEINANDLRQGIIGLLQSSFYIASIVLFLNWFRRAYGNIKRLGVPLNHEENMAVWCFIIPIISLYRPYQVAREIVIEMRKKLSETVTNYYTSTKTSILGLWWALFLITNFIEQIALRTVFKDETIEQIISSTQAYLVSDFMDIFAALVTLIMIKQISKEESLLFETFHNHS